MLLLCPVRRNRLISVNHIRISGAIYQHTDWCGNVVMSVTIAAYKRCPVRRYLQLFVWGLISYLRYLYLVANSGVQHILCCVFVLFCLCSSYVPYGVSVSGLDIGDYPFGVLQRLYKNQIQVIGSIQIRCISSKT